MGATILFRPDEFLEHIPNRRRGQQKLLIEKGAAVVPVLGHLIVRIKLLVKLLREYILEPGVVFLLHSLECATGLALAIYGAEVPEPRWVSDGTVAFSRQRDVTRCREERLVAENPGWQERVVGRHIRVALHEHFVFPLRPKTAEQPLRANLKLPDVRLIFVIEK